eukprot:11915325-Alexandrium_andersonii.AAC.1
MKAENIAYNELVRAIQRVVHRKHVLFQGPWVVPVSPFPSRKPHEDRPFPSRSRSSIMCITQDTD